MNQKGFANIILVVVIIALLLAITGYAILVKKNVIQNKSEQIRESSDLLPAGRDLGQFALNLNDVSGLDLASKTDYGKGIKSPHALGGYEVIFDNSATVGGQDKPGYKWIANEMHIFSSIDDLKKDFPKVTIGEGDVQYVPKFQNIGDEDTAILYPGIKTLVIWSRKKNVMFSVSVQNGTREEAIRYAQTIASRIR